MGVSGSVKERTKLIPSEAYLLTDNGYVYEIGKAFGLMGFISIGLQFILSSRRKWIERPFGLDMIISFHKAMAVLAGMLFIFDIFTGSDIT